MYCKGSPKNIRGKCRTWVIMFILLHIFPLPPILPHPQIFVSYPTVRNLHSSHQCEECVVGSLFHNYYEIEQYPDPGQCEETSGSQVKSFPNHQHSMVATTKSRSEENKRKWRKNIKCNICDDVFSNKANLAFHMNRKQIPLWEKMYGIMNL